MLLYAVVVGIILALVYFAQKVKEKRQAELAALAQNLGLQFLPKGMAEPPRSGFFDSLAGVFGPSQDQIFIQRFAYFQPFGQGHSPDVENLMIGSIEGIDWYLFDYSYKVTTSNGKTTTTTTHNQAVVAARIPMTMPGLDLCPENILHRIGNKLGMQELNFELEEFNRRYFIRSGDSKGAYDLLHPQAIEFLMSRPVRHWQMSGIYILLFEKGSRPASEFMAMFQEIRQFVGLIPAYYRQDHGFAATWRSPFD